MPDFGNTGFAGRMPSQLSNAGLKMNNIEDIDIRGAPEAAARASEGTVSESSGRNELAGI